MTERNVRMLRDKGVLTEYRPGLYNIDEATRQYINFFTQEEPGGRRKGRLQHGTGKIGQSEEGSAGTGTANEEK